MSVLDGVDLAQYEPHVQLALKFATAMEGHKPADCALAAVKVLAFCAYVGSDDPKIVMEATRTLFAEELQRLKDSGIKPRNERPLKTKSHLH